MKKATSIFFFALCLSLPGSLTAGGLLTNTNQSASFARFMALDASTTTDAVYYNPAGLAMLDEGWHLYLTNQSAFQTRTIDNSLSTLNHAGYKGTAHVFAVPSFQLAWRTGKWAFSAGFGITGGGGKAEFDNGLPAFETQISVLPRNLNPIFGTTAYGVDLFMNGTSLFFGTQLGATYKISEHLSVFGGARVVWASNRYEGYIQDIQLNPGGGPLVNAYDFFTSIGQSALAAGVADKYVDARQTGAGVTPILGLNFNWKKWNIGVKYEAITKLEVKNNTTVDDIDMFPPNQKTPSDIPALLTAGISYHFLPKWTVAVGYHHFFDTKARMENDRQQLINHGINEYLCGLEWDAHKYFLVSAGFQLTRNDVQPAFQTDITQSFSSYSLGFGGAIKVNPKIRINLGYFFTDYTSTSQPKMYTVLGAPTTDASLKAYDATETYGRTNHVATVGVDIKF